jgi:hypothetical protein
MKLGTLETESGFALPKQQATVQFIMRSSVKLWQQKIMFMSPN